MSPKEVVSEFPDTVYDQNLVREAFEKSAHPDYIQHKPT